MNHKITDLNFLLLFSSRTTQCADHELKNDSTIQQFVYHSLFDYHLISVIYDYIRFPLLAPQSFELQHTQYPVSICIHPHTHHLWAADPEKKCLLVHQLDSKEESFIRTIKCNGKPICIRISNTGRIIVIEHHPVRISNTDRNIVIEHHPAVLSILDQFGKYIGCFALI